MIFLFWPLKATGQLNGLDQTVSSLPLCLELSLH